MCWMPAMFFALYGRDSFMKAILTFTLRASLRLFKSVPYGFVFGQRKGSKRKASLPCWPAASLCASAQSGRCGTRCAQTALALIRSKLPVLDNTKWKVRSKTRLKTDLVAPDTKVSLSGHTTVIPAQAGIQT